MNLTKLIGKELWQRKSQLISGLLAVTLGIGVIVSIRMISTESEKAVAIKLDNLGANILVLPQSASVDDYYAAEIDAPTFPESYVEKIATSTLPGVDNMSPKLSRRIAVAGQNVVLTGIQPKNEIASKPIWQQGGITGRQVAATCAPSTDGQSKYKDERLQRKVIDDLAGYDCFAGSSVAQRLQVSEGSEITIEGRKFNVTKILPETGTIDDDRIFANLYTVQELLGVGAQVNAIEIMGCCNEISQGLLGKLRNILPDTRITTINQIVETQQQTNLMMRRLSWIFLLIILVVGGLSIGNSIWANVNERRREIGILRMIGYHKTHIYYILIAKALVVGVAGGFLGYITGTMTAVYLSPSIVGISVHPEIVYLALSVILATIIAFLGAVIPAILAGRIEPFGNMQET